MDFTALFNGDDFFNQRGFMEGAFGTQAMAGVVSGMAGNFVNKGIGKYVGDPRTLQTHGFNINTDSINFGKINTFAGIAGSAASAAVEYGMTGSTTVNILNANTLSKMFGQNLTDLNGHAVTTGLFGLTMNNDGVRGSITMSGHAMDIGNMMVGMQSFKEIYLRGQLQDDLDSASAERDRLNAITDRVIGTDEVSFTGASDQAQNLLRQLGVARSVVSNRNLHDMFQNRAENGMSEATLDENLVLAYAQGDIGDEEFMNSRHFDTNGSFKLANQLHQQTIQMMSYGGNPEALFGYAVTTEEVFRSGKAFAGESANSATIDDRTSLFLEYYASDIHAAEAAASPEQMFDGIFLNSDKIERAGIGLDGSMLVRNMLESNMMTGVGDMLTSVQGLRDMFIGALNGGPGSDALGNYKTALFDVMSTGALNIDGRYTGILSQGNGAATAEQRAYVEANRDLYQGGIRRASGAGYFNYYKDDADGKYYRTGIKFDIPNGKINPLLENNNTVEISERDYLDIQNIENGTYASQTEAALQNAINSGADWRVINELAKAYSARNAEMDLYSYETYCNLHTAGVAVANGAINVQSDGISQFNSNSGINRLNEGLFNDTGGYLKVNSDYTDKFSAFSLFGFGSWYNPNKGESGHMVPWQYLDNDISFMNVGEIFNLDATRQDAFGTKDDIEYWLWLNW